MVLFSAKMEESTSNERRTGLGIANVGPGESLTNLKICGGRVENAKEKRQGGNPLDVMVDVVRAVFD